MRILILVLPLIIHLAFGHGIANRLLSRYNGLREDILLLKVRLENVKQNLGEGSTKTFPLEDTNRLFADAQNKRDIISEFMELLWPTNDVQLKEQFQLFKQHLEAAEALHRARLGRLLEKIQHQHTQCIKDSIRDDLPTLKVELMKELQTKRTKRNDLRAKLRKLGVNMNSAVKSRIIRELNSALEKFKLLKSHLPEGLSSVATQEQNSLEELIKHYQNFVKEEKEEDEAKSQQSGSQAHPTGKINRSREEMHLIEEIERLQKEIARLKGRLYANWTSRGFPFTPSKHDRALARLVKIQRHVRRLVNHSKTDTWRHHLEQFNRRIENAKQLLEEFTQSTPHIRLEPSREALHKLAKEGHEIAHKYSEAKLKLRLMRAKLEQELVRSHHEDPDTRKYVSSLKSLVKALLLLQQLKDGAQDAPAREEITKLGQDMEQVLADIQKEGMMKSVHEDSHHKFPRGTPKH